MKAITGVFTLLLALGAACTASASEPEARKRDARRRAAQRQGAGALASGL
jgi:hypothetical protein